MRDKFQIRDLTNIVKDVHNLKGKSYKGGVK